MDRPTEQQRVELKHRIIYVTPDCTDSAVKKRARGFAGLGHALLSFSFRRVRYDPQFMPDWPNVELGRTTELRLASRIFIYLRALAVIYRHRREWQAATILYARNLDLAMLALLGRALTRTRAEFVYEILDIHPTLAKSGWRGSIFRWLERRVLKRSQLLAVSSPAFLASYFRPVQHYQGPAFVLENKWPSDALPVEQRKLTYATPERNGTWTIGWFGNLRCRQSLDILAALADAWPQRVIIYLRGCASLLGESVLRDIIDGRDNMIFGGEFIAPADLPAIYSNIHFNWCVDFSGGDNSLWLLPNRLYEGGYFGVPAIAIAAHETGRTVQARRLGFTLEEPLFERLQDLLRHMTPEDYVHVRSGIEQRPAAEFVDTGELAQLIAAVPNASRLATSGARADAEAAA